MLNWFKQSNSNTESNPTINIEPETDFYREIVALSSRERSQFLHHCLDRVKEEIKKQASQGSSYAFYQGVLPDEVKAHLNLSGFNINSQSVDKHYINWGRHAQLWSY